jgi:tetratricopeptide (TPR) repeat protein
VDPKNAPTLDSRGFIYLKMGKFDSAIADYDTALAIDNKLPTSLYGRGQAKRMKGDPTGSVDMKAGQTMDPAVAAEFKRWGLDSASSAAR